LNNLVKSLELIMKQLKAAIHVSMAAALLAMSTNLFAAKDSGVTGTLTMMGPDLSTAFESLSGSLYPAYGDNVAFDVAVEGRLARNSWIYVTVVCRQQDSVVYQSSNWTDFTFAMEDLPGQGLEWDGNPAECTANLVYRVEKGREAVLQYLDSTSYSVK
jgi:hypothetical protein